MFDIIRRARRLRGNEMTARYALQDAIAAVRAGDMEHAQLLAIGIVRDNPDDPNGWYLLSQLVDSDARRAAYLSKTLALDPNHARARIEFDALPPALVADLAPAAVVTAPVPVEEWEQADAQDDDQDTPTQLAAVPQDEALVDAAAQPGSDLPGWLQPLGAQQVASTQVAPTSPAMTATPPSAAAASRPKAAAPARKPVAKKKKKNSGNQALSILLGLLALLTILVLSFLVYLLIF